MAVERTPDPTPEPFVVHIVPMRRRHVRGVLRIEQQVYPRPWTMSLFLSELALRSSRAYFVARIGRDVVGYGGLMMSADDGHITTLAVDPRWQRHQIGTRLLLVLAREADRARGAEPHAGGAACRTGPRRSCTAGSASLPSASGRTTTPRRTRTRW